MIWHSTAVSFFNEKTPPLSTTLYHPLKNKKEAENKLKAINANASRMNAGVFL